MNDSSVVVRNKVRLVAQGCNQEEGIDFDKTFASVARLQSIRMLSTFDVIRISFCIKWMLKCFLKWLYYGRSLCETTP